MLPFFAKSPSCLVGIETCGTSHHWARELIKPDREVRLMPPAYVEPTALRRVASLHLHLVALQRVPNSIRQS
jgi:transposase